MSRDPVRVRARMSRGARGPSSVVVLAAVFAMAACGGYAEPSSPARVATTVTTQPASSVLDADQSGCSGLGRPPSSPELTWQAGNELRSANGCILRFATDEYAPLRPAWSPAGDALLVDVTLTPYVVTASGQQPLPEPSAWTWAGVDGTLLSRLHDGALTARLPDGSLAGVLLGGVLHAMTVEADGLHIVGNATIGGVEGIYRIDVRDGSSTLLHRGGGLDVTGLTAGGDVLLSETDGEQVRLYRLDAATSRITPITTGSSASGVSAVPSRYDDTALAWYAAGGCGGPPRAEATLQGRRLPLHGTPVEHAPPEGWLPDGTLLFLDRGESCDYSPGTLWAFKDGRATEVADGVLDVAIRPAGTAPSVAGG